MLAIEHGARFASRSAGASLLGLLSFTAFVIVYGWMCCRRSWTITLPIGWLTFLACTAVLNHVSGAPIPGLALAATAFVIALRILQRPHSSSRPANRSALPPHSHHRPCRPPPHFSSPRGAFVTQACMVTGRRAQAQPAKPARGA